MRTRLTYIMCCVLWLLTTMTMANERMKITSWSIEQNFDDVWQLSITPQQDFINCDFVLEDNYVNQHLPFHSLLKGKTYSWNLDNFSPLSYLDSAKLYAKNCQRIRPAEFITAVDINSSKVDSIIDATLNYLQQLQIKQTVGQRRYRGEWGSQMVARKGFAVLLTKKGTAAWDSNCFTTSTIVNVLSAAYPYLTKVNQQRVRQQLELALTDVLACEEGGTFNFWHEIEIPSALQRPGRINRVRSPNNFPYRKRLFYFFSNVVNDADDTAVAYLALDNIEKILGINRKPLQHIGHIFSTYRDLKNRHVVNLYDLVTWRPHHTEAFLTWLSHNEFPFVWFPSAHHQSIPMRTNDVDCVVNSNILTTLARYQELDSTDGVAKSCKYLKQQIHRKKFYKCALYYPNKYMFPYVISKAINAGVKCLANEQQHVRDLILANQRTDGSWDSFKEFDDLIQSTALSLNSLLNIYSGTVREQMAIKRGLQFLLQEMHQRAHQAWWPGGIYFSGGTFARKRIVWKSSAYTTALVLEILVKYQQLLLL